MRTPLYFFMACLADSTAIASRPSARHLLRFFGSGKVRFSSRRWWQHSEVVSCHVQSPFFSSTICTVHFAHTSLWLDLSAVSSSGQSNGLLMYSRCCLATRSSASTPRNSQSMRTPLYFFMACLVDLAATSSRTCAFTAIFKAFGKCNKVFDFNAALTWSFRSRT